MNKVICAICNDRVSTTANDGVIEVSWHRNPGTAEVCYGSNNPIPKEYVKLTKEDQEVLRSWSKKKEKRRKILEKASKNKTSNFKVVADQLRAIDGNRCEHDRSLYGTCSSCSRLEDKLRFIFTGEIDDE